MKKFLIFLAISFNSFPSAVAAPTVVQSKSNFQLQLTGGEQVSAMIFDAGNILITGTTDTRTSALVTGELQGNSDGFLISLTGSGQIQWSTRLGNTADEMVTAIAQDSDGTYWVLGAASTLTSKTGSTNTPSSAVLNPDNVVVDRSAVSNSAFNKVKIWQISKSGSILNSFESTQIPLIEPKQILIDAANLIVVGNLYSQNQSQGFILNCTKTGVFQPITKYGLKNTKFNAGNFDGQGNLLIVGSSGETIGKSKNVSTADAVAIRISNVNSSPTIARASLKNTTRSWSNFSSNLFISGWVNYSAKSKIKSEFAITKFSTFGKPIWSNRFAALKTGTSQGIGNSFWAAFSPTSNLSVVKGWQPKGSPGAVLKFDAKGKVISAFQVAGNPILSTANESNGLILLTEAGNSLNFYNLK